MLMLDGEQAYHGTDDSCWQPKHCPVEAKEASRKRVREESRKAAAAGLQLDLEDRHAGVL